MCWLKVDDEMWCNPKVVAVSNDAKLLWVWAMNYSANKLTDGVLKWPQVQMLAGCLGLTDWKAVAAELVENGLFEVEDEDYVIHDYLEYNPSREQVLAQRTARSEAGRRGGQASAQAKAKQMLEQVVEQTASKSQPRTRSRTPNKNISSRKNRGKPEYTPAFEEWWAAYPRKMGKADAFWLWEDLIIAGEAQQADLLTAARNYARAMRGTEQQFIKLPSTFLGPGRHFEDFLQGVPGISKPVEAKTDNRAVIESEEYQRALREGRI